MIWNFFKKREKTKEKLEMINIINEEGKEISVEKEKWIEEFLKPNLEKNKYNNENLYNLILVAINYNIYKEVIPYALLFLKNENNSKRSIDLLISIYYNTNSFSDVISFSDLIVSDDDIEKTARFYYYYAMSFKKLSYLEDYETNILLGISKFPNNKNLIKELLEILENKNQEEKEEILLALKDVDFSYKLNLIFSEMKYLENEYIMAKELIKNALIYSKFNIGVIKEVKRILFKYNQHLEFENLILPKFDIREKNIEFINLVLDYYKSMYKYESGIELLNKIYELKLINDENRIFYLSYENEFLKQRFMKKNKFEYNNMYSKEVNGDYSYINISKPLSYYFLSKNDILKTKKEKNRNFMFLPIAIDEKIEDLSNEDKDFLHILPLVFLEKSYTYSDINMQIFYRKDSVYIKDNYNNYSLNYFRNIAKINKNLENIITAYLTIGKDGEKYIRVYGYNCKEDNIFTVVDSIYLTKNKVFSINKILKKLNEKFNLEIDFKNEISENEIKLYLNKFKIFFNVDKNNRNRKLFFENEIDEYLKNINDEESLINALSILKLMKKSNIALSNIHFNKIYDSFLKLDDKNNVKKIIEDVFEKEVK